MVLPTRGNIDLLQIAEEFDDNYPDNLDYSLNEFYRGGTYVPATASNNIPTSGRISLTDFYGAEKAPPTQVRGVVVTSTPRAGTNPVLYDVNISWTGIPVARGYNFHQYQVQLRVRNFGYTSVAFENHPTVSTVARSAAYQANVRVRVRVRLIQIGTGVRDTRDWSTVVEHIIAQSHVNPVWDTAALAGVQTFTYNTQITSITVPAVDRGTAPVTYSAAGLPTGLQFNTTTRVISGTPSVITTTNEQITITATNNDGDQDRTATYTITYRVVPPAPTNLRTGTITSTTAEILWNAPTAPTGYAIERYEYQIRQPGDEWPNSDFDVDATSATFSDREPSTNYHARVRAVYSRNSTEVVSSWTSQVAFTTAAPEILVVIAGPTERTVGQAATYTPTITGTEADGNVVYTWQRRADEDSPWVDVSSDTIDVDDVPDFRIIVSTRGSRTIRLRINPITPNRDYFSNLITTTWGAPPLSATISASEENPDASESVTFSCDVEGGVGTPSYQWQRRQNGTGTWADTDTGAEYSFSAINQTWEVRCVVTATGETVTTDSITVTWPVLPTISVNITADNTNPVPGDSVLLTATVTTTLTGATTYAWTGGTAVTGRADQRRVTRATAGDVTASVVVSRAGTSAPRESITITFVVLPVPTNLRSRNIADTTAEIFWEAVTAPTGFTLVRYEYALKLNSATNWPSGDFDVDTTSATYTNLTASTSYNGRVRAVYRDANNNIRRSAWTGTITFTTIASQLNIEILAPTNRHIGDATTYFVARVTGTSAVGRRVSYWWFQRIASNTDWNPPNEQAFRAPSGAVERWEIDRGILGPTAVGSRDVLLRIRAGVTRSVQHTITWDTTTPRTATFFTALDDNIESSSATLTWFHAAAFGTATRLRYELAIWEYDDDEPANSRNIRETSNSHEFTGLQPETTYISRIRTIWETTGGTILRSDYEYELIRTLETEDVLINAPTSLTVREGGSVSLNVRLTARPDDDVDVEASESDGDISIDTPRTLTFTSTNWRTNQTFTVRGIQDGTSGSDTANITLTASGGSSDTHTTSVTITNVPINILAADTLRVDEGGTADLAVKLSSAPRINTTVTATESSAAISVSPAALSFTPATWNTNQNFTITGEEDSDRTNETATLTLTATGGSDARHTSTITVVDDDTVVATIVAPTTLTVTEGSTATLSVRLSAAPTASVTVRATESSPDISVSPATRTFTTTNWNRNQSFTIRGLSDADAINETATLTLTATGGSTDTHSVTVTVEDDDERDDAAIVGSRAALPEGRTRVFRAGGDAVAADDASYRWSVTGDASIEGTARGETVTVRAGTVGTTGGDFIVFLDVTSDLIGDNSYQTREIDVTNVVANPNIVAPTTLDVDEGSTATLNVRLASRPDSSVTVRATESSPDISVSPATRTFTTTNWNRNQSFTIRGLSDADAINETATLTLTATGGSTDTHSVTVTVEDDDERDDAAIVGSRAALPEGRTRVFRAGGDAVAADDASYRWSVTGDASIEGTARGETVTVRAGTVGTTGGDFIVFLDVTSDLIGDNSYQTREIDVTNVVANPNIVAPTTLDVDEGSTATLNVRLASRPDSSVTVRATESSPDISVSPATRTFTTTNWNRNQSFTITARSDNTDFDDETAILTLTATGGSTDTHTVTVTVEDDDTRSVYNPPRNVTVGSITSSGARAAWAAPSSGSTSRLARYAVQAKRATESSYGTELLTRDATQRFWVFTGFPASTAIDISIVAVYADSGRSARAVRRFTTSAPPATVNIVAPTTLTVTEGSTATLSVRLSAAPTRNVSVAASENDSDISVSPARRTFTATNWNRNQSFTVTGVSDSDTRDDSATLTLTATGGSTDTHTVTVTVDDDDLPQLAAPRISASAFANRTTRISWSNVANNDGYTLEYKRSTVAWRNAFSVNVNRNATSIPITINVADQGSTFNFRLRADGDGTSYLDSAWSNTATRTAPAAPLPVADAGSITITNKISTLSEDDDHDFAHRVSGGTFDTSAVSYSATRGSITAAGVYSPPDVTANTNVTVTATRTVTGTGTDARRGTRDTATDTDTFRVTPVLLPVADAGSITITNKISTLDEDDDHDFSHRVSGGTFDTSVVSYSANRGTITAAGLYTPPGVISNTSVTVTVTRTVTGTGTEARRGTRDTATDTDTFTVTPAVAIESRYNPPRNFRDTATTSTSITMSWSAPASGSQDSQGRAVTLTGFEGNISDGVTNFFFLIIPTWGPGVSVGASVRTATLTSLTPGYYYATRIRATYSDGGVSAYVQQIDRTDVS